MRLLVAFSLFLLLWAVIVDARKGKGYSQRTDEEEGSAVGGVQELPEDYRDENFPLRRPKGNKRGKGPNNRRTPESDQEGTQSPVESPPEDPSMTVENRRQGHLNRTTPARGRPSRPERGQDRGNKGNRRNTGNTEDGNTERRTGGKPNRQNHRRGNEERGGRRERPHRDHRNRTRDEHPDVISSNNTEIAEGQRREEPERPNRRNGEGKRDGKRERPDRNHRNRTRAEHSDRSEHNKWDDLIDSNQTEVATTDGQMEENPERPQNRHEGRHRNGKPERPDRHNRNRTRGEKSERNEQPDRADRLGRLHDRNRTRDRDTPRRHRDHPDVSEDPQSQHGRRNRNRTTAGQRDRPGRPERRRGRLNGTRGEETSGLDMPTPGGNITEQTIEMVEESDMAERRRERPDRNRTRGEERRRPVRPERPARNRTRATERPERRRGRLNGTRGEETRGLDMPTAGGNITEEKIEMVEESDMAERRRERPERPARNRTRAAERPERRRDRPKTQDRQPNSPSGHNSTDDTEIRGMGGRPDRRRNNRTREDQKSRRQRPDRHRKHEEDQSAGVLQENGRFASCEFGEWTKWSECQAFLQMRTRDVITGARNCFRRSREYRNCD